MNWKCEIQWARWCGSTMLTFVVDTIIFEFHCNIFVKTKGWNTWGSDQKQTHFPAFNKRSLSM